MGTLTSVTTVRAVLLAVVASITTSRVAMYHSMITVIVSTIVYWAQVRPYSCKREQSV